MKKQDIQDELAELSSFLGQLKEKGEGMSVPPDYFDRLNDRVMERLEAEGEKFAAPPRSFWGLSVKRTRLTAIAAAVTLLLAAWWWLRPAEQARVAIAIPDPTVIDTLTQEDAATYVHENILEFEMEMLAAEFDNEETTGPETTTTPSVTKNRPTPEELDNVLNDLTEEELEDLL